MAARQALRLFEAGLPQRTERSRGGQHRVTTVTPRAALQAAGVRRSPRPHYAGGCA
jgi:hypothetical protein